MPQMICAGCKKPADLSQLTTLLGYVFCPTCAIAVQRAIAEAVASGKPLPSVLPRPQQER